MYITEKKLLKWALYSNAVYILLLFLFRPNGINPQKILITSLLLLSVLSVIILAIKYIRQLKNISKFARVLFYAIIFWGSVTIIRGFSLSIQDWVTNFGNVYMAMAWLVPFAMILGLNIKNWNVVFKAIFFMFQLMVLAFLLLPFYEDIYTEWTWLLRPVNFILLMGLYKFGLIKKIAVYIMILIYIIIAIKVQQRMEFLYLALVLGFLSLEKLFSFKVKKRFLKYIFGGFILVFTLIFTVGYEFVSNLIATFIDFQETRVFLFKELFEELAKTNEKFFGRGSLGSYYSFFFEGTRKHWERVGRIGWVGDDPIRNTIEVGYLQMVLKGGFIMLGLNISLYLHAIYKALFRSNNKFIKRLGYYILTISILSLISFRPAFTPTFILFWMAIGTVLNKKYRSMSDEEINEIIQIK